jgi:uncharacterized protein YjbI with pentapeptide repeats
MAKRSTILVTASLATLLAIIALAVPARADIFEWEYINPSNPAQGKQQSATLAPDGAGANAVPGTNLSGRNLTMAYLIGANVKTYLVYGPYGVESYVASNLTAVNLSQSDLTNAYFGGAGGYNENEEFTYYPGANLTEANLNQADATNANFFLATLTGANFTGSEVRGANFDRYGSSGTGGITAVQLYSTASYQAHDLSGIALTFNNLAGVNFASQNLTNANFNGATLTNANLSQANLTGANLSFAAQLSNANLSQANFTNANLSNATLTGANFSGAEVRGANFYRDWGGTGITAAQLYSTASYLSHDLTGIRLDDNDLTGVNLAGQNLTNAYMRHATLANANLNQANLTNADFSGVIYCGEWCESGPSANLSGANLSQANLTNANFGGATLTGANLTGAEVRGANLGYSGFTAAQLYSTVSYQAHDLSGIGLGYNNLAGADLTNQNLTNADFYGATLTGVSFNQANLTGANLGYTTLTNVNFTQANLTNAGFSSATLTNADLSQLNLSNANFYNAALTGANLSQANLTNADFWHAALTGANLTGAEVRGANFYRDGGSGITLEQLYSTASYVAHDLTGIELGYNNLAGANFVGQNLTNAGFGNATLTNANFSQANLTNAGLGAVTGVNLTGAEVRGAAISYFTAAQLYSTASYQARDLTGIRLYLHHLQGANLVGQNLSNAEIKYANLDNANFSQANLTNTVIWADLTGVNLSGVDARGANFTGTLTEAITSNLIRPDGHVAGLNLTSGASLVVRDYDGNFVATPTAGPLPIVIEGHLAMDATGTLRLVFDADPWDSTISFAPGIPVALGGTLELSFASDVDVATQSGRTIDLFDWTGVTPTGAFTVSSPYTWNLSNLYTTGEVMLTAVSGVLPGDFNNDGTVDAADYTVWRKGLGTLYTQSHYDIWRANFGAMLGSGGAALPSAAPLSPAVPEPATFALLALGLPLIVWRNSRRSHTGRTRGAHEPMTVLLKL